MCFHYVSLFICLLVSSFAIENVKGTTSSAVPDTLYNCYRDNIKTHLKPPQSLALLIELIRKIEIDDVNALNMRMLATSMLHGLKFDGIRRTSSVTNDSVAIPYRATGEEFFKYRLIVDFLTAGESSMFPSGSLTTPEFCFLHEMISNSADPRERGDESRTCAKQPSMPQNMPYSEGTSECPIKLGIVKSVLGPISAGHLILAVASALEDSRPTFYRISEALSLVDSKNTSETTRTPPTTSVNANIIVDNVWVATLAGDLAQAILNQPSAGPDLKIKIASDGLWNDTLLPRIYYVQAQNWEMTAAEILAGIDGLAMASYLKNSGITAGKLRLSQLIDMYYSGRGMGADLGLKATNRTGTLNRLLGEINLDQQVAATAELLKRIGTYDVLYEPEQIRNRVAQVMPNAKQEIEKIAATYDVAEDYLAGKQIKSSALEVIVVLDGSYDFYTVQQMIYNLAENLHVSHLASRMGVLNGQTGTWMVKMTHGIFDMFTSLQESQNIWPTALNLGTSLETVLLYYNNRSQEDCLEVATKPVGRAILILSPTGQLTDNDLKRAKIALDSLQKSYPEVRVLYVTEKNASVAALTQNFPIYVVNPADNILSSVGHVADILATIPGHIVNFYCSHDQKQVIFEDYITPGVTSFYQIPKEYTSQARRVITSFSCKYGEVTICALADSRQECKHLTVNGEISFDSEHLCGPAEEACILDFNITANSSLFTCLENECRFPDQVRVIFTSQSNSGFLPSLQTSTLIIALILLSKNNVFY